MKGFLRSLVPYALILAAVFYGVPAAALAWEHGAFFMMFCLLVVFPAVCFFVFMAYADRRGFSWLAPLACGILFAPAAFVFFNYTALVYAVAYMVLGYIGEGVGLLLQRGRRPPA